jgi:hypothetical protein
MLNQWVMGCSGSTNDVIKFINHASLYARTDCLFFAICDGDYYLKKYKGYDTRIEYLNKTICKNNCYSLTINELEDFIRNKF